MVYPHFRFFFELLCFYKDGSNTILVLKQAFTKSKVQKEEIIVANSNIMRNLLCGERNKIHEFRKSPK